MPGRSRVAFTQNTDRLKTGIISEQDHKGYHFSSIYRYDIINKGTPLLLSNVCLFLHHSCETAGFLFICNGATRSPTPAAQDGARKAFGHRPKPTQLSGFGPRSCCPRRCKAVLTRSQTAEDNRLWALFPEGKCPQPSPRPFSPNRRKAALWLQPRDTADDRFWALNFPKGNVRSWKSAGEGRRFRPPRSESAR